MKKFRTILYFIVTITAISIVKCQSILTENDMRLALYDKINAYREIHKAPELIRNKHLEDKAHVNAAYLATNTSYLYAAEPGVFHRTTGRTFWRSKNYFKYGQLFNDSDPNSNPVEAWYSEQKFYPNGTYDDFGNFTQLVWNASRRIGCGVVLDEKTNSVGVTCYYEDAGNDKKYDVVNKPHYVTNVDPTPTTMTTSPTTTTETMPSQAVSEDDIRIKLYDEINAYREIHEAPKLKVDEFMENRAHLNAENIAKDYLHLSARSYHHRSTGSTVWRSENYTCLEQLFNDSDPYSNPVKAWYSEREFYPDGTLDDFGNFTQLVWKKSQDLGCGVIANTITKVVAVACFFDEDPGNDKPYEDNKPYYEANVYIPTTPTKTTSPTTTTTTTSLPTARKTMPSQKPLTYEEVINKIYEQINYYRIIHYAKELTIIGHDESNNFFSLLSPKYSFQAENVNTIADYAIFVGYSDWEYTSVTNPSGNLEVPLSEVSRTFAIKLVTNGSINEQRNYGVTQWTTTLFKEEYLMGTDESNPVLAWYSEEKLYPYCDEGHCAGNFTQLVWKNSTRVGCAMRTFNGTVAVVCFYMRKGNQAGKYEFNVRTPKDEPYTKIIKERITTEKLEIPGEATTTPATTTETWKLALGTTILLFATVSITLFITWLVLTFRSRLF